MDRHPIITSQSSKAVTALLPLVAYAQVTDACSLIGNVASLVGVFGTIVLIAAFAVLLYAAALFITGGGNEETLRKARLTLIWALVGLAVALLAGQAGVIVKQLLGGGGPQACPTIPEF